MKLHLIDDVARKWWRLWSVRLNAFGLALLGWVQFDPLGALSVWNMMPPAVRNFLPPEFLLYVGLALFALSMVARLVVQPKLGRAGD